MFGWLNTSAGPHSQPAATPGAGFQAMRTHTPAPMPPPPARPPGCPSGPRCLFCPSRSHHTLFPGPPTTLCPGKCGLQPMLLRTGGCPAPPPLRAVPRSHLPFFLILTQGYFFQCFSGNVKVRQAQRSVAFHTHPDQGRRLSLQLRNESSARIKPETLQFVGNALTTERN